ncbi:MAG: cyclic nucleotide-binding domain-containing protein [Alphaproteobacteria bacterium]|nr:cyclic nucleotide-binding domain-containing protein [Alphaproteobacteria bacterium]
MAMNVTFKAGQVIFREGDQADAFYVLRTGKIRITRGGVLLEEIGRDAFFGEMALIDTGGRSATATAVIETECVEVQAADFNKRLQHLDPVMQGIFRVLVERIRRLDRIIAKNDTTDY